MGKSGRAAWLAAVLVASACTTGQAQPATPSSTIASSAEPSTSVSPSASAAASASAPSLAPSPSVSTGPTAFTSATYGYGLTLPPGWSAVPASKVWDGTSGLSSDSAEVDQFTSPTPAAASGVAAPFAQKLPAYVLALIAGTAKYHGDTCPAKPESQTPIKIGTEAAVLVAWNCGILINNAVTVHQGIGYQFLFRDPTVHAATDPADQAIFQAMLESVTFPN